MFGRIILYPSSAERQSDPSGPSSPEEGDVLSRANATERGVSLAMSIGLKTFSLCHIVRCPHRGLESTVQGHPAHRQMFGSARAARLIESSHR
jgi:hypothetical protein